MPAGQSAQVVEPVDDAYVPASHAVQAEVLAVVLEYVPKLHGWHEEMSLESEADL